MTGDVRFYDAEVGARLRDLWFGNARMEAALRFVLPRLPSDGIVLEIGGGIGWAAERMVGHRPELVVHSCDLSRSQVDVAERIFPDPRVHRAHGRYPDVLHTELVATGGVNAVVMVDVFEHIPVGGRARLAEALKEVAPGGRLILTCPTPRHQEYLRRHDPSGLQPVDEDVTREDLDDFAAAVGGRVLEYREVSVWNPGDYLHAILAIQAAPPPAETGPGVVKGGLSPSAGSASADLKQTIEHRLGARPSRAGLLLPRPTGRSVLCMATPREIGTSETFIRAQIEELPFRTHLLHGSPVPTLDEDGIPMLPGWFRALRRVASAFVGPDRAHGGLLRRTPASWVDRWVARHLRSIDADVVFAQYGPVAASVAGGAARARLPLVAHFHGYDAWRRDIVEANLEGYRRMWAAGAHSIAVSAEMVDRLVELGAPRSRVHLVPCGLDMTRVARARPEASPPLLVAVGRFVPKKDPESTIRAFARAAVAVPGARLVFAGDGELRDQAERWAESLGVRDRVDFPGALPHSAVLELMGRARGFAQHSREAPNGDREGSPVAVLEAAASGLPVISTRHAGIPALVDHERTGWLVEEGDWEGMAVGMEWVLRDAALADRWGAAARAHVAARYARQRQLERLAGVVEAAMADGPA